MNEYQDRQCNIINENNNIETCNLKQCNASFKLGVKEFDYDKDGKLKQTGYRFRIENCFAKELNEYMEYLCFFWSYERFGLPFQGGWAEMPSQLFQILNALKIESQYMRKKIIG